MRVGIIGSARFENLDLVRRFLRGLVKQDPEVTILLGGSKRIEEAVISALPSRAVRVSYLHHDTDMERYPERLVAFWNGTSERTLSVIVGAQLKGTPVEAYDEHGRPWPL